tara:strand:+ start:50 stop:538 length:489 start_codon:yes stop_codon:yes gene_type:complete
MSINSRHIGLDVLDQFKYDEVNGGVMRVSGKGKGNGIPKPSGRGYTYYKVAVDSVQSMYKAHRLVYLLHNPDMDQSLQIDHINGIRNDNRIENLRAVTHQQNHFNRADVRGFYWAPHMQKFHARIGVGVKQQLHLGYHETMLDARAAYLRAKKIYHIMEEGI